MLGSDRLRDVYRRWANDEEVTASVARWAQGYVDAYYDPHDYEPGEFIRTLLGDGSLNEAQRRHMSTLTALAHHIDVDTAQRHATRLFASLALVHSRIDPTEVEGDLALFTVTLCQNLRADGLRKRGDQLYAAVLYDGVPTHAYRKLCSMREWVYNRCSRPGDPLFNLSCQRGTLLANVTKRLEILTDTPLLDFYKPDRMVHAFRNGCLDLSDAVRLLPSLPPYPL